MLYFVFMCATGCLLAYYLWRSSRAGPKPPSYPGALPLIGHVYMLPRNSEQLWNVAKEIYSSSVKQARVVSLSLGPKKIYLISDPDDCLTVSNTCLDKMYVYKFAKSWLGNGLVTADVPTWKRHRKLLNVAFSQQMLNGFIEVFNAQAKRLVGQLLPHVGNGPFIPEEYLVANNFETVTQTTLNFKVNQRDLSEKYIDITKTLFSIYVTRFMKIWMHIDWIYRWSANKKLEDELLCTNYDIFNTVIQNRKLELQHHCYSNSHVDVTKDKFKSLLDTMIGFVEDKKLSNNEARNHLDTVVIAASDTSSLALMYMLLLLGSHKEVQERVYNELVEVLGSGDTDVDKHSLSKLVYLEAVLKESMRLYPVAPAIGRLSSKEVKLKDYTLPAGSICIVNIYGLHRHPSWGPDVEHFRPERWLDPATLPANPSTFAGFSLGRRSCIGKLYGLMSMKITMAHVLRRYRITADVSKLVLKADAMLKPKSGHEINLELRI